MQPENLPGPASDRLSVDVWSDVVCPFCYMGHTLLNQATDRFGHGSAVDVRYHSFLLMPHLSPDHRSGVSELLVKEKGMPLAQAEAMNGQVTARGRELGLDFRFDTAIAAATRMAHRLIHFAGQEGRQIAMVDRLFRAYFTDGLYIGDAEVLAGLAAELGLDREEARKVLDGDTFDDRVDADLREARRLGVSGVPFFVFDGKYALSGAQPVDAFVQAMDAAWATREARAGA